MAQEFTIIKTDNGRYIVKIVDPIAQRQHLSAFTNFGAVIKEARILFDETIVRQEAQEQLAAIAEGHI